MSPASWLPRTGISSGTLRSVIEYGLPFTSKGRGRGGEREKNGKERGRKQRGMPHLRLA